MSDVNVNVRASAVNRETFCKTYAEMALAGKTVDEIAKTLGMNKPSVVSRASSIRKELKEIGGNFPFAKTTRGKSGPRATTFGNDALKAYLAKLTGANNVE